LKGRIAIALAVITALYVVALIWVDSRNHIFDGILLLSSALPLMVIASFASYLVRYARWRWLLGRTGHWLPPFPGLLAYLAGLAFTATPGKVGELVRIRYCAIWSVPASTVLAAYVFERALDLLVVLALACFVIKRPDLLMLVAAFVGCAAGSVVLLALWPAGLDWVVRRLRRSGAVRLTAFAQTLREGLVGCRTWFRPADLLVGSALGLAAWTITSLAFVYLTGHLHLPVPFLDALAIYPMAMLVGAASMLPGGLGSTEATITGLLALYDVSLPLAVLAAVGIRLATIWFAIVCGLLAIIRLEARFFSR
jgi:uncharacterized protein (TIRG00374 family)